MSSKQENSKWQKKNSFKGKNDKWLIRNKDAQRKAGIIPLSLCSPRNAVEAGDARLSPAYTSLLSAWPRRWREGKGDGTALTETLTVPNATALKLHLTPNKRPNLNVWFEELYEVGDTPALCSYSGSVCGEGLEQEATACAGEIRPWPWWLCFHSFIRLLTHSFICHSHTRSTGWVFIKDPPCAGHLECSGGKNHRAYGKGGVRHKASEWIKW